MSKAKQFLAQFVEEDTPAAPANGNGEQPKPQQGLSPNMDRTESPPEEHDPQDGKALLPKKVEGGIVFKVDMVPADYNTQTARMRHVTMIKNKRWNAIFNIFQVANKPNIFHVFLLFYSPENFTGGATGAERANRIMYFGTFNSKDAALNYLKGEGKTWRLPQDKSIQMAPNKQWTAKELGI